MISFTIGSSTYQGEAGSDFGDWVGSDYNTDSFKVTEDYVFSANDKAVEYNNVPVAAVDTIVADGEYTIST